VNTPQRFRTALDGEPGSHLMGLFVAFTFGSSYPVAKPLLAFLDPYTFAATRYVLASTVLLTLLWMSAGPRLPARADWPRLLLVGLLGYTVFQGVWGVALSLTSASKAVILVATTPVFSALADRIGGARLSAFGWGGIALAFTGVFVVVNNSITELTVGDGSLIGDLLFVGIAALWAVYGVLSRPLVVRLGALRTIT
jgi:O-acetylserine/cysteine efflux transporter